MSGPDIATMGDLDRLAMAASMVPVKLDAADFGMTHDGAKAVVRAVLQALREPSSETAMAGMGAMPGLYNGCDSPWEATFDVWQAMIDHILSEPTP